MSPRQPGLSEEERRASLLADIDALPGRRTTKPADGIKVQTDFLSDAYQIVVQAALDRRISVPAFVRRATYAMACFDMGLPLQVALDRDPRMARDTGLSVPDPEGVKFGAWEIEGLRDGTES